jgi:hypothetical protein
MTLLNKILEDLIRQSKLLAQMSEISYRSLHGTRQTRRSFTNLISQGYWEASKWYFVNVERANIADKLQPRDINVSFTNYSNVAIDVLIFTFYSDQLVINVETGIVNK